MTKANRFLYLTFVFGLALQSAWAEEIKYQGLKLAINNRNGGTQITLDRPSAKQSVLVERIENPTRLIIDIPSFKIGGNRTFQVNDSQVIAAARFGVHPDKTRIVLDVRPEAAAQTNLKVSGESGKRIVVGFGEVTSAKTKDSRPVPTPIELKKITSETLAKAEKPEASPSLAPSVVPATPSETTPEIEAEATSQTPEPEGTINEEAAPIASPTLEATPLPTEIETPTPLPAPKVVPTARQTPPAAKELNARSETKVKTVPVSGKMLTGLDFAFLGDQQSPVLKIALGERTEFRLSKTDTKFYTIVIPGFGVAGKHLLLPFFPPKDFVGFSVVTAKETLAGLEIAIGVDPGVRLTAFADSNSILVKLP
jgi:hypothetical protein